eukprot:CAMPEP_0114427526 /NCGR_PEP_ID=MMETSP0103-20121206/8400_1 /TAXON_ID=37642 ORGANISM="Paraphysomonas imperforata, Strain PA2" /NCGR_SAMPLE_ID=MMETSP0103 /ASSEMBLY_ACC=CAM_ASM_000201 /LENGTH=294 /DNA_ID=CAMNT_0001596603 /DNA_START=45 /DNA_END=929 /DNA_ORIENTATION=-
MTYAVNICPCCLPATLIGGVIVCWILLQTVGGLLFSSSSKEPPSLLSRIITFVTKALGVLLILFAILLGVLESNEDLRKMSFSMLCAKLTQDTALDVLRCGLLEDISGRVLEIGPGPATNFRCLYPPSEITEWVGVEPNNYFLESIESQKLKYNISFDTSLTWLKGEAIDAEDEGFDAVISTHVLCSVSDVNQVLRQISRVLKPGGTFYFMEHVAASDNEPMTQLIQKIIAPVFFIVGNGCEFRELWNSVTTSNTGADMANFDITLRRMSAPMGLPFMRPHIIGKAVKAVKESE